MMAAVLRLALLLTVCFVSSCSAYEVFYDGYELIEVYTESQRDRNVIVFLKQLDIELDFWYKGAEYVHIFAGPEKLDDLKAFLTRNNLKFRVINDHVARDIEKEEEALLHHTKAFNVNDFNTFEDIVAEMNSMVTRCRADLGVNCQVNNIGKTYEGRDLLVFRMWKSGSGRKAVWIDATTHAREWLGTATHLKIMTHLVDDYTTDSEVQSLVDKYDWYLMPVVNPDGYSYAWTDDRMWRKNRSPNAGSSCIGTDLNRNFETDWGNAGTSTAPCDSTYGGAYPASELETQAVQSEAVRLGASLLTTVHIHTYGQLWLIPWGGTTDGTTCKIATDDAEMMLVANPAADAVENTFGTSWRRGNSCATIYPASGITMDYFKAEGGVKYVATPELRGDSFVADSSEIQPSYEELWNGITTAILTIEGLAN